jgi:hypothetical protein
MAGLGIGAAMQAEHRYVVEVRKPTGEVIRGNVTEKSPYALAVGTFIGVEGHAKTGDIRFDPNAQTYSVAGMLTMTGQMGGFQGAVGPYGAGAPAARKAATDRLRELSDRAREHPAYQQAGGAPAVPAEGFAGSSGPSAFDIGGGQGSVEERLATLKQLHDKGVLTDTEYEAKRQQIISSI